ncbi:hypothetical protein ACLOJK_004799 [Asimina triloba]
MIDHGRLDSVEIGADSPVDRTLDGLKLHGARAKTKATLVGTASCPPNLRWKRTTLVWIGEICCCHGARLIHGVGSHVGSRSRRVAFDHLEGSCWRRHRRMSPTVCPGPCCH